MEQIIGGIVGIGLGAVIVLLFDSPRARILATFLVLGVIFMAAAIHAEIEFTDACGRELRVEASVRAYEGEAYVESIDNVEVHDGTTWVEVHDYVDSEVHDAVLERIDDPWALTAECLDIECGWDAEARGDALREEGW